MTTKKISEKDKKILLMFDFLHDAIVDGVDSMDIQSCRLFSNQFNERYHEIKEAMM